MRKATTGIKIKSCAVAASLLASAAIMSVAPAHAQAIVKQSIVATDADAFYARALEMMRHENYSGVIDQLSSTIRLDDPLWAKASSAQGADFKLQAMVLMMQACYERGDEQSFALLYAKFLEQYPGNPLTDDIKLLYADFYFFRGNYAKAVEAYSSIDLSGLDPDKKALYEYRLALSLTRTGYFSEAQDIFTRLKKNADYTQASTFYLAYIDYVQGRTDQAEQGFKSLSPAIAKELGADYYLCQIDFKNGKYKSVINQSPALLRTGNSEWTAEINRITGESYYNIDEEASAEPYLRRYVAATAQPELSALYDLAVIDYNNGNYSEAAQYFSAVVDEGERLAQSSYLYLGQIEARQGDYSAAALSFQRAYNMGWDSKVSETALYNYAVASTKGSNIPFSSSSKMLEEFVSKYPNSQYASTINEHLATAYFQDKEYLQALQHIRRLKNPGTQAQQAKQKILFQLGVQSFNKKDYTASADYMSQAAALSKYDSSLASQAYLWQGDALYNAGKYAEATKAYTNYNQSAKASDSNKALGLYNLGYSLYQEKQFAKAKTYFSQALKATPALESRLLSDCKLRIADCDYYTGNVSEALKTYNSLSTSADSSQADYAAFQAANMQGAMGNNAAKISQLNSMIESYPGSVWLNDARLELTQAYIADGKLSQAQKTADTLRDKASDTSQARKAALAVAAANYDAGNASQAISDYKALIRRWPTSDEASQAVTDLKTIYANSGNIDDYIAFLNTVPNAPRPDASELESLTFEAAVKKMEANPTDPTPMNEYLAKYPSGTNADQALLYVATAQNDAGNSSEALKTLDKLLTSRPDSRAVPAALMMKANLLQEAGNNSKAAETWKKLLQTGGALYAPDAYTGLMQTASKPADVISYADKLLSLSSLTAEEVNEANLRKALALKEQGKTAECSALLQTIIVADQASQQGAEATVALSEILLSQGKTSDAEKHLLTFINSDTDSQYWLAKAYIALADTYKAQGNTYKAKEYLKALKSNYPGNEADITSAIQTRLSSWK